MLHRSLQQVQAVGNVLTQVEKRFLHRLANQGVRGKVHNRLRLVLLHYCVDRRSIGQVALDEDGLGMNGSPVPLVEIVENDNRFAGLDELLDDDTADIAGATRD